MISKIYSKLNNTKFEKNVKIGKLTKIIRSSVGRMTYIGDKCFLINTRVGRFCSIASNVRVVFGEHPTRDFVSSSPVFYKPGNIFRLKWVNREKFLEFKYTDQMTSRMIDIGNDVWIGFGSMLLNGIKVGDGAVIAAGSVVTKDVPPYAIIGGNPAKVIRFRFDQLQIDKLLQIKWWDKDLTIIRHYSDYFDNVDSLLSEWGNKKCLK